MFSAQNFRRLKWNSRRFPGGDHPGESVWRTVVRPQVLIIKLVTHNRSAKLNKLERLYSMLDKFTAVTRDVYASRDNGDMI